MKTVIWTRTDVIVSRRRGNPVGTLKLALDCVVALLLAMTPLSTQADAVHGDGALNLYNDTRKESLDIRFRDAQGRATPAALKKIETFLRSPDDKTHTIDLQLIDLVDAIQDHFQEPVIEIISGYRSPDYNHALKLEGRAVANESLHIQGRAMDIHLDTVTEEAVRDYARSLKRGGVGWYPQNDFVHVDVGEIRTWGHPEGKRKWVGLNNNTGPLAIRTDANHYFRGKDIFVKISPPPDTDNDENHYVLEHFKFGEWKPCFFGDGGSLSGAHFRVTHKMADKFARGRYRLRIADSLSNEFYLKN